MSNDIQPSPRWYPQPIGDRIRLARRGAGFQRPEDLGRVAGIHRNSILNYETGKSEPLPKYLEDIAEATGVDIEWLKTGKPPRDSGPGSRRPSNVVPLAGRNRNRPTRGYVRSATLRPIAA